MDLTWYSSFSQLQSMFNARDRLTLLKLISIDIDNSSVEDIIKLIYFLYGKWPVGNWSNSKKKEMLALAAKRGVQARYYVDFYGFSPSKAVLNQDEKAISVLSLSNELSREELEQQAIAAPNKTVKRKIKKQIKVIKEVENAKSPNQPTETQQPKTKPPPPRSYLEVSDKVKEMELPDIIEWAIEMGVPQERIDKHKDKPLGLAKMNIGNLIRGRVRASS